MAAPGLNRAAATRDALESAPDSSRDSTVGGSRCSVSVFRVPPEQHSTVCLPVHKIWLGTSAFAVEHNGSSRKSKLVALPAGTTHRIANTQGDPSSAIYLDARRFKFTDAERLAERVRGFVPGRDDPLEVYADALKRPAPRLDVRLEKAVALLEAGTSVAEIARAVRLSESRLSHLFSEYFGTPLRAWRAWLLLRRSTLLVASGSNFTHAAHAGGFADAAHYSRTHRNLIGVTPTTLAHYRTRFVTEREQVLDCEVLRGTHRNPRVVAETILSAYGR